MHKVLGLLFILSLSPLLLAQNAKLQCATKPPAAKSCTLQKDVTAELSNEAAKIKEACEKEQFSDEYLEAYRALTNYKVTGKSLLAEIKEALHSFSNEFQITQSLLKRILNGELDEQIALSKEIIASEKKIELLRKEKKHDLADNEQKIAGQLLNEYNKKFKDLGVLYQNDPESLKNTLELYEKEIARYKKKEAAALEMKTAEQNPGQKAAINKALSSFLTVDVDDIKTRKSFTDCGLSPQEILSIRLYTDQYFSTINAALRNKHKGQLSELKPIIDSINSGLKKLKPHTGMVLRGADLPEEVQKIHCPSCIVTYDAYTSTSTEDGFNGSSMFVIKSKKGRYIAPLSSSYGEEEVLFAPGTKFKILKTEELNNNTTNYTMSEQ